MNIVMLAEALILGVPIIILSNSSPIASFLVKMLIVVLTVILTLGIFFAPKVAIVKGWWELDAGSERVMHHNGPAEVKQKQRSTEQAVASPAGDGSKPLANSLSFSSKMGSLVSKSPRESVAKNHLAPGSGRNSPNSSSESPSHSPKASSSSELQKGDSFNLGPYSRSGENKFP